MRLLSSLLLLAVLALAAAAPASAADPAAQASTKRCATPRSFMVGPFFADQVRARGVSCRFARRLAKRWGGCRFSGPRDRFCRVSGYGCRYRAIPNFEGGRTRCTRGRSRAVGFRFGS